MVTNEDSFSKQPMDFREADWSAQQSQDNSLS